MALFVFEEDLRLDPNSILSLLGRAQIWAAQGRPRDAIPGFSQFIDLLVKDAHATMAKVAPYIGRKRTATVRDELFALYWPGGPHDTFETLMDTYVARAQAHAKSGQLTHALSDYQRVLQIVPRHAVVSVLRNQLLARIRRELNWRADDVIRRAMESVDRGGNPFAGLSELYPNLARRSTDLDIRGYRSRLIARYKERALYEVAVTYLLHWARTEGQWRAARFHLHSLYSAIGEYENALKVLDAFIADNPHAPNFRRERATVHAAQGRFDLAVTDLTVYLDNDMREDFEAWHQRARAYAATGAYDRAIEDLNSIEPVIFSTNAILNFDMARFHAMKGDYTKAIQSTIKAIALAPEFARAYELRALAYFILATVQPPQQDVQNQWNGCTPPPE